MVFEWDGIHSYPADPQKVGEAIQSLAHSRGGAVDSAEIVEAARRRRSALHPLFTWDDSVAGEMYRRQEAGRIVRCLVVVQDRPEGNLRRPAYYHVNYQTDENGGEPRKVQGYQAVDEVREIPEALGSANEYLLIQLTGLQRRQQHLVDPALFEGVWRSIEEVREQLENGEDDDDDEAEAQVA